MACRDIDGDREGLVLDSSITGIGAFGILCGDSPVETIIGTGINGANGLRNGDSFGPEKIGALVEAITTPTDLSKTGIIKVDTCSTIVVDSCAISKYWTQPVIGCKGSQSCTSSDSDIPRHRFISPPRHFTAVGGCIELPCISRIGETNILAFKDASDLSRIRSGETLFESDSIVDINFEQLTVPVINSG